MKILMAQCNFTVGDFSGNKQKILDLVWRHGHDHDLIVFSELCLSGYYPMDLVHQPGFLQAQEEAIEAVREATRSFGAAVVLGFIDRNHWTGKPFHNGLMVLAKGVTQLVYHKRLLPTYNIFDEARHFEPGNLPGMLMLNGYRIGFAICEDLWNDDEDGDYATMPIKLLAREKPDFIVSINASPSNLGKQAERLIRFRKLSAKYRLPLIYVNQVGGNDEIVFDGNSFVTNANGELIAQLPAFAEHTASLMLDENDELSCTVHPRCNEPSDVEFYYQQIVMGLRDYVSKCGFRGVVVGSSGGIDSAVTLALAHDALGAENVVAVTMPSRFSSEGSVTDSVALCTNLGIKLYRAPIEAQFKQAVADFTEAFGEAPSRLTQENMQARIRGRILMEYSNHHGNLVLSTGNKSEMSVGYATLYGDMNGGLNLIGDLYKMEVYALARYLNEHHGREIIPQAIIDKAPSAELFEGQKDQDSLPPYPVLDAILRLYIERDLLTEAEIAENNALVVRYADFDVNRVLRMVDAAEFKRRQAPPIIRVHRRSFGTGRRMPIAKRWTSPAETVVTQHD
ncbi:NAD+ synthase [Permianibacter sp. IMCC34836]|uniref:NAD+ synthase n=1 Tax=Permianibacter fluminis TaxID=2738515 RepID=UPI001553E86C|nr:NAD+ synthase [Permianibacter fluminis]NQD35991.1 NAD+ synthase [Permianibacter fluminis]